MVLFKKGDVNNLFNMNEKASRWLQWTLAVYWVWGLYHLVRDMLQIMQISTFIADIGHRRPNWCVPFGEFCNYIVFPIEIYVLIAVPLIWNRKKIGIPEILVLLTLPLTVIMWLLP